ncbi:MAG: DUF1295 domain-containing protein [Clostridia bacterium]|nr:DUF1295 domain-containing protein [Clostridia bacterium]
MISLVAIILIITGAIFFSILYFISVQPASLALRIGDRAFRLCGVLRMVAMIFELLAVAGYILFVFGDMYNYTITVQNVLLIRIIGILFTAATLVFMFIGAAVAGKEAALPNKETELYGGLYHYMRHPQTLSEMLSWFGIAMILNSLTLLLFSIIWIPLFISFTVIEDNDLAVRFGKQYLDYTEKVGIFWKKSKKK